MPHDKVMRSIELFGTKVAPVIRARTAEAPGLPLTAGVITLRFQCYDTRSPDRAQAEEAVREPAAGGPAQHLSLIHISEPTRPY